MDIDQEQKRRNFFVEWLEKLQQESWQLELIISGFALYGVYNAKGLIVDFNLWLVHNNAPEILGFFDGLPETGWKIFFINLLLHVILRALWIGSIGLRYVSSEIDYDKLNYSTFFTEYLRKNVGIYDDFIERLERLCSVLFSYTFLLFLMAVSFSFLVMWSLIPFTFVDRDAVVSSSAGAPVALIGFWIMGFWIFGAIVFFDFVTGGRLKKVKDNSFSKYYFYLYQLYSILSLSIFYRPLLYNFLDNKYTRRLFYFSFIYILVINNYNSFFSINSSKFNPIGMADQNSGQVIGPAWYQDEYDSQLAMLDPGERQEYLLDNRPPIRLSSFHLRNNTARLFLRISDRQTDRLLTRHYHLDPIYQDGVRFFWQEDDHFSDAVITSLDSFEVVRQRVVDDRVALKAKKRTGELNDSEYRIARDSLKSLRDRIGKAKNEWFQQKRAGRTENVKRLYQSMFDVKIDAISINDDLQCVYFNNSNTYDGGLLCTFNADSLTLGRHELMVDMAYRYDGKKEEVERREYVLPFVRE